VAYLTCAVKLRKTDWTLRLFRGTVLHMAGKKSRAQSAFWGVIAGAPNKGTVQIAGDKLDGRFFRDEAAPGKINKEKVGIRAEPDRTWVG